MANPRLTEAQRIRLREEPSVWLATVKPNSTAHLIPVWAVLHNDDRLFIGTGGASQKVRNILAHGSAAVSLPDPNDVLIVEGEAAIMTVDETPPEVLAAFQAKYGWDVRDDADYVLAVVTLQKVLAWKA
jgi:hypothetical protein